jgi:uncharacterized protein (DUF924 family)
MTQNLPTFDPAQVLDFWFPDDGFWESQESFGAWIEHRMQGGVDDHICAHFADLTEAAAKGMLDHWAETPRGRLALLLALDQFPRSLWRDTPAAFGQDIKSCRLVMEGISNGHVAALRPWEKLFFIIALGHCEGPDHLGRFDLIYRVSEELIAELPEPLAGSGDMLRGQNARVRAVIARYGRHPHRNPVLGRISTPEEEAYIATGDFPHVRSPESRQSES